MQARYTFQEIAEKFYEAGLVESPKNPYGTYPGNKREYVHEVLSNAPNIEGFLRTTVPHVCADCDIEGPSVSHLVFLMEKLGYTPANPDDEYGFADYDAPAELPQELLSLSGTPPEGAG